jgi:hypothetical protein
MALVELIRKDGHAQEEMTARSGFSGEIVANYIIITDNPMDDENVAVGYLPQRYGQSYNLPESPPNKMFVQTLREAVKLGVDNRFKQQGSIFEGTLKYTRLSRTEFPDYPQPPSPVVDDSFRITAGFETQKVPLEFAYLVHNDTGVIGSKLWPVQNTLSLPFDVLPEREITESTWSISRTEYFNPVAKMQFFNSGGGAVNRYPIWGYDERQLHVTISSSYSANSSWSVEYRFKAREATFDYFILNTSQFELSPDVTPNINLPLGHFENSGTGDNVPIKDRTSEQLDVKTAVPITSDGKAVQTKDTRREFFYRRYNYNFLADFSLLALPNIAAIW